MGCSRNYHANMYYDFDSPVDRRETGSVKWGYVQESGGLTRREEWEARHQTPELIPMWVADMDFPAPEPVIKALARRAEHGVFGYTASRPSYFQAVQGWMKRRHGWDILPDWICPAPGVVPALNMLIRAFCSAGGKVIVQTPVYYPFFSAVRNNGRELVSSSLVCDDASLQYSMDYEDLIRKVRDDDADMIILCNPHNPVGRVWTREELIRLGEMCLEHNVLVVSDEIHGDLVFNGAEFVPFARISREFEQASVICTAPSKTFNLAGLQTSNIIIPDPSLRARFIGTMKKSGLFGINIFGAEALEAAYNRGEEWLQQVLAYIEGNYIYLKEYLSTYLPDIHPAPLEGTYLVWLDFRSLGVSGRELSRLMLHEAGVYLDDGFIFGDEGDGFERINIACPRQVLKSALDRIRDTVQ